MYSQRCVAIDKSHRRDQLDLVFDFAKRWQHSILVRPRHGCRATRAHSTNMQLQKYPSQPRHHFHQDGCFRLDAVASDNVYQGPPERALPSVIELCAQQKRRLGRDRHNPERCVQYVDIIAATVCQITYAAVPPLRLTRSGPQDYLWQQDHASDSDRRTARVIAEPVGDCTLWQRPHRTGRYPLTRSYRVVSNNQIPSITAGSLDALTALTQL